MQGQLLFLPSAWWHEVDTSPSDHHPTPSLDEGGALLDHRALSINFWFRAEWPRQTLRLVEREVEDLDLELRGPALRQLGFELAQRGRLDAAALLQRSLNFEADKEAAATLAALRARFG